MFLKEVINLPAGSIITFDKGYVDYGQYEEFTQKSIWYVTRLKDNALYKAKKEYDIPDDADNGVLKDEVKTKAKNITPVVSLTGTAKTNACLSLSQITWNFPPRR